MCRKAISFLSFPPGSLSSPPAFLLMAGGVGKGWREVRKEDKQRLRIGWLAGLLSKVEEMMNRRAYPQPCPPTIPFLWLPTFEFLMLGASKKRNGGGKVWKP